MTVKEVIAELREFEPDLVIVLPTLGGVGTFAPLSDVQSGAFNAKTGECGLQSLTREERLAPLPPRMQWPFEAGEPIRNSEGSWDMAFVLTAPEPTPPPCRGDCQCRKWNEPVLRKESDEQRGRRRSGTTLPQGS